MMGRGTTFPCIAERPTEKKSNAEKKQRNAKSPGPKKVKSLNGREAMVSLVLLLHFFVLPTH
jgi:hypothetical protein